MHQAGPLLTAVEGQVRWQAPELAEAARQHGAAVALAQAYRQRGSACLAEMHGQFAIAVVDMHDSSGLLAIDRLGTRTMCYADRPGTLVFGSSADSVVAHPSVGKELASRPSSIIYIAMVPSPGTIYRTVRKLLPGECVTLCRGAVERRF
jgi:asparagine synthase (glutamine-hydrolysing)